MRPFDIFGLAVAALITLLSPLFASFPIGRSFVIVGAFVLAMGCLWIDYWYYSNYSLNGGIWHISIGMPPAAPNAPEKPSRPAVPPEPLPSLPIQSRLDRFIFRLRRSAVGNSRRRCETKGSAAKQHSGVGRHYWRKYLFF
jgi:hypothetical protein